MSVLDVLIETTRRAVAVWRRRTGRAEPVGCSHIRLLPANPPGDWIGVQQLSMERTMAAKKKKAAKKGGAKKKK
jgi:hypothetical protein